MIPSDEDRAVAHIGRISEDQEGYFASRDRGVGYIFHAPRCDWELTRVSF
ncbi:MAG: hypothetical protein ACYDEV_10010 [Acidiferrobacter sp.]